MKSLEPNCPVILNDGLLKNDGLNEIAVANVKALTKKTSFLVGISNKFRSFLFRQSFSKFRGCYNMQYPITTHTNAPSDLKHGVRINKLQQIK